MSTTTVDRRSIRNSVGPGPAFHRVLNSEFIKFRTLTSTLVLLASTAALIIGIAALSAQDAGEMAANATPDAALLSDMQSGDLAYDAPTMGVGMAVLIFGSLGVLLMSSEFTTGMARSTFAAVPKRFSPFVAKLLVITVTGFALTATASYIAGLVTIPILDSYNIAMNLANPASIRRLLVYSAYMAAIAGTGMALGTILRNAAGAIMALVTLIAIAPGSLNLVGGDVGKEILKYLPSSTLNSLLPVEHPPGELEAWQAALVLGAWVIIPAIIAMILLKKRDI
ncbi:ABC transporter permease [Paenarthrobacter sp. NPDC056912]|uniref:ABC transporter permease n=1 Tax=Paenarthrobacter sp. NPDC056912 TaxID=3345965 RepID=UPI003671C4ED